MGGYVMRIGLWAVLLSVVFISTGCTLHSIASDYKMKSQDESIVIGSLKFPEGGVPFFTRPIYGTDGYIVINTIIAKDFRQYRIGPTIDGSTYRFTVALPQGRYRITEIRWGELIGEINGIFTIYENGKIYYIGSMEIDQVLESPGQIAANFFMFGRGSVPLKYRIVDDYKRALEYYAKAYPHLPRDAEKSMIVFKNDWDKSYNQFRPLKTSTDGKGAQ
jgi:hypothetical protein